MSEWKEWVASINEAEQGRKEERKEKERKEKDRKGRTEPEKERG